MNTKDTKLQKTILRYIANNMTSMVEKKFAADESTTTLSDDIEVLYDLPYENKQGVSLSMDVYYSKDRDRDSKLPVHSRAHIRAWW